MLVFGWKEKDGGWDEGWCDAVSQCTIVINVFPIY